MRTFAQRMIGDHTAVNDQALALVKKLNMTPEDNPISQSLTKQADTTRMRLAGLTGTTFDKAYVDNDVAFHKTVNSALSTTFIPNAKNSELKTLLENGLKVFEAHLEHAERLAQQLSSDVAARTKPVFHLEDKVAAIDEETVSLEKGGTIEADLVVVGIGVRPRLEVAENSGLKLDRGVAVSSTLETSAPGVYAAGDIARWPDPHSGDNIRIEHWVIAQRQGQVAALNMLGHAIPFTAVPFFWSQHYDVPINYVGLAEAWDEIVTDGSVMNKDCVVRFKRNGRVRAVASIFRDIESLEAEVLMEHSTAA